MKKIAHGALGRRAKILFLIAAAFCAATLAHAQAPFEGVSAEPVTIRDYVGEAMDPFISRDGRLLFFNTRTEGGAQSDLLVAARIDALTFRSLGPVRGANSTSLDSAASLDREGNLYFVSTRDYAETLNTMFVGRYREGAARTVTPVSGLSGTRNGRVLFDAHISGDGRTLYYVDGLFFGGALPWEADIAVARRYGAARFARDARSSEVFARINTGALEYAPALSADERELFFTRMSRLPFPFAQPSIWRASRAAPGLAFEAPTRLPLSGYVEAPSAAPDGSIYFHQREDGRYRIRRLARTAGR